MKNFFLGSKKPGSSSNQPENEPLLPTHDNQLHYKPPDTKPDGMSENAWHNLNLKYAEVKANRDNNQLANQRADREFQQRVATDTDNSRQRWCTIGMQCLGTTGLVGAGFLGYKTLTSRDFESEEAEHEKRGYVQVQYIADR